MNESKTIFVGYIGQIPICLLVQEIHIWNLKAVIKDLFKVSTSTKGQAVTICIGHLGYLSFKRWQTIDDNNTYYTSCEFPYKTSKDERLLFYNITRCYNNGEYCHVFAIEADNIIKYQGGNMMRNADARTVRSRQETFNSNGGHDT